MKISGLKKVKVSDCIAEFLRDKKVDIAFGIIGSANSHIFDSINKLGFTQIVHVHNEQAATMAAQTYYRTTGQIAAVVVTAGAGSSNAITGVISAWADSIPTLIISGQETTRFIDAYQGMRMWGIQGFDIVSMVNKITKYAITVRDETRVLIELEKAYQLCLSGRFGPCWLDFPLDIQGTTVSNMVSEKPKIEAEQTFPGFVSQDEFINLLSESERPIFWLGHGIRLDDCQNLVGALVEKYKIPVILSWAAKDLLPASHPLNMGSAGVYGNRASNLIVQNSDLIIAIGTRLAIPMIGYEKAEFARAAKLMVVDIDAQEIKKNKDIIDFPIQSSARKFITDLIAFDCHFQCQNWIKFCKKLFTTFPINETVYGKNAKFLNSYQFVLSLSDFLKNDDVIVTDMGTGLLSGHQVFQIFGNQRMMTSTGLGEMGYGLPGAIGAAFGRSDKRAISLNCDGGLMLNLQELQTVDHYRLNIKLFVFNNDGYLMIKHTQKNLFEGRYSAVNAETNVTCPNFEKLAKAFNFDYLRVETPKDYDKMSVVLAHENPVLIEVMMDPEQYFYPKLGVAFGDDGGLISPPLEDLAPLVPLEKLQAAMTIPLLDKSRRLKR